MVYKKLLNATTAATLAGVMLVGCSSGGNDAATGSEGGSTETGTASTEIKEFTSFFAVPGTEINSDNVVQQKIAEITGAKMKEVWLTGQTDQEAVGTMIAGGEYPDFIVGSSGSAQLYEAGALVALDDYIDNYPNIKNFWTEAEWNSVRRDDGHIYWIPQFGNIYGEDISTTPNGESFWIQTRVLKWAGYPEIKTLDQYFDVIQRYNEANPTLADGTPNIPYTILSDDWRYFCLENPPLFLAGYPNDGSVIVNPETKKVEDYNTSDVAKRYFAKLNELYKTGIVDQESFTQSYDQYIAKLSTGRVLGMVDQHWNFYNNVNNAMIQAGLTEQGTSYVPLSITMDENIQGQWNTVGKSIDVSGGVAITTSCEDVEGALKFIDDLLSPEVRVLRQWGIEGQDYLVDENGLFYRNEEMRANATNPAYLASNLCSYSYMPNYQGGYQADGINASTPGEQPSEYFITLQPDVQEILTAYNLETLSDLVGRSEIPGKWYPMWSYSNTMTTSTDGGKAWVKMGELKHEYLPKVVMSADFEAGWNEYMGVYSKAKPEDFLAEMQTELDKRLAQ